MNVKEQEHKEKIGKLRLHFDMLIQKLQLVSKHKIKLLIDELDQLKEFTVLY